MLENLHKYKLILASNSPRRQELLAGLGTPFSVRTLNELDESYPECLECAEVAEYIASKKAEAYRFSMQSDELILTADTVVSVQNCILGKPADREDAIRMLTLLSGKKHTVYTGICLTSAQYQTSFTAQTAVTFGMLSDEEIRYYVDTFKPFDKAGAYGVQEWIGFVAVEHMDGSYYNVMGLPVHQLYVALTKVPPLIVGCDENCF
jgi:septum formation protein